jgi:hypothetical protein
VSAPKATDAAYWQSVAQDAVEALAAILEPQLTGKPVPSTDLAEATLRGVELIGALSYDTAGSASSQNYIDTGVRLLAEPADPELLVGYVDAGDDEEEVEYHRHGQLLLACPWKGCQSTGFYEVDRAERWNPIVYDDVNVFRPADVQADRLREFDGYVPGTTIARYKDAGPNPLAGLPVVSVQQGSDGDGFATSHHLCRACHRRVSIPEWLETEWQ